MTIEGTCEPKFERVREEFERNFAERDELGASLCVIEEGEPVVDLWGGFADDTGQRPWDRDTVNVVMSATKGMTALCGNMLMDRGLLDPDRPISHYWPEFAKNGKESVLVRMAFNHQSGVVVLGEQLPEGGLTDWDLMIRIIEEATPAWEPGTRQGYHSFTNGFMIGELVRRITGTTVGSYLRHEVAEPLGGLDLWIGLPTEIDSRVAPSLSAPPNPSAFPPRMIAMMSDPESLIMKVVSNIGGYSTAWNTREAMGAEIPAANGVANARSLAGMYAPLSLGGEHDGVRLVSPEAIARMRYPQSMSEIDVMMGIRTSYTMGFSKSWPNPDLGGVNSMIIGEDAFGCPGSGGQVGFADPSYRLAFGYTMNRMGAGTGLNQRGQSLVDATYRTLGSPTCAPGCWIRPF